MLGAARDVTRGGSVQVDTGEDGGHWFKLSLLFTVNQITNSTGQREVLGDRFTPSLSEVERRSKRIRNAAGKQQ
jgi:hypothetical protein